MRTIKSLILLCAFMLLSGVATPPVSVARPNQEQSAASIDVAALLAQTTYKYVEVRRGLWKIPDISYDGKNLSNLVIFLEPNPNNKSLRISFRLGFLKDSSEITKLKEKLNDLSKRFDPTEFVFSDPVVFVVAEPPADKLDKTTLEKVIKGIGDVSDEAYPELNKFIRLDLESSRAGYGAGAPGGPDALSPSILKTPDSPASNAATTVDSKPVILNRVTPAYTDEARNNKVEGTVLLRVLVDETGAVKTVRVIRGLPDGLNEKAVEAGYKLKFKPAMKDGKAVAYWAGIQMTFNLR